jgi:hypothetical protein
MRDVHAPDAVSWWPPALGWWLLAAVLLGLMLLALYGWWWRRQRARDWRVDARFRLRQLARSMDQNDSRTVISELSELLRRVAMARFGRSRCAGLSGDDWLTWLSDNDPSGFDWQKKGRVLLELPYLPPGSGADNHDLRRLVAAAKRWVSSAPDPTGSGGQGQQQAAGSASDLAAAAARSGR